MNQERIEAAYKAISALDGDSRPWLSVREGAEVAIAAADAVMFSEEAVERMARHLTMLRYSDGDCTPRETADGTDLDLHRARLIIAALKGDGA